MVFRCYLKLPKDTSLVKYYLYISDAKIDALLPQVPHEAKKKVAIDLGVDFKIFKATRKSETESDESRISRLEAVLSFIREYGNVGTVDDPDDFVDDTQHVWFGPDDQGRIAYFTGRTERTTFALAGSARHLIGSSAKQQDFPSFSPMNAICWWLREQVPEHSDDVFRGIDIIAAEEERKGAPQQRLEFMAKRLLFSEASDNWRTKRNTAVLLATPLYVAMTD
jgi:hypothetical protein